MHSKTLLTVAVAAAGAAGSPIESQLETRSCNPGFKNTVFNSGVNNQPDINGRFRTLQSYGTSLWVGFTLYDAGGGDSNLIANQLRMVLTANDVQPGVDLVTGPNAPQYLQLLNEPDGGFYGQPILSPQDAASVLQPFFSASTGTKYLSPAPAYPQSNWLPDFFAACNCADRFPVILAHIYNPDPNGAIAAIQTVMNQFPGKTIWITEISPASSPDQGCTLDQQGMINWMNTVIGWASQQAVIERVFWNSGEYGTLYPDNPGQCNPSLTNFDGTPTALLQAYSAICA
ncbi:putative glycoside superfamily [Rosellinia necatrix]|uniref:Putative glycoside superfamily n=1 Tax=Rosellinia necatrix TaxID=77044 RepID=A0A1W2TL55_ROSNE|nr:putative glycoside superfamily [Rosellinia necatrix]